MGPSPRPDRPCAPVFCGPLDIHAPFALHLGPCLKPPLSYCNHAFLLHPNHPLRAFLSESLPDPARASARSLLCLLPHHALTPHPNHLRASGALHLPTHAAPPLPAAPNLRLTLPRGRTFQVAIRLPARAARVRVIGRARDVRGQLGGRARACIGSKELRRAGAGWSDRLGDALHWGLQSLGRLLRLVRGAVSRRHTHAHRRCRLGQSCWGVVPVGALCSFGPDAERTGSRPCPWHWWARARTVTGDMGQG